MRPEEKIQAVARMIQEANSVAVFTGAGISTESGIPDFRSNGGLWDGKDPFEISHAKRVYEDPLGLLQFYRDRYQDFQAAKPNKAHEILALWEQQGRINAIVTQNIDGYHQQAGSKKVINLHGDMRLRCTYCGKLHPPSVYDSLEDRGLICTFDDEHGDNAICGGDLRPNVVLFGEDLPTSPMHWAYHFFGKADLAIVIGSSCSVHPANTIPEETIYKGKGKMVIINKGETAIDHLASIKINEWGAGLTLETIHKALT